MFFCPSLIEVSPREQTRAGSGNSAASRAPSRAPEPRQNVKGYVWGLVAVTGCTMFSALVARYLDISELSELVMIQLLPVIGVSTRFGIRPSLFTAALSTLSFDFFFIPPVFSFAPSDVKSFVTLIVMLLVAGVISGLSESARRQHAAVRAQEVQIETERLRNSLLSAVSHDLRTPLATILGAGTELLRDGGRLDGPARDGLAEAIVEEAARLDQLVTNLLGVARLEGGSVEIRKRPEPLDEVVEAALGRLHGRLGERPVQSHVPQAIPMVSMDAFLIAQVLVNLLENALRYSSDRSPVEVEAIHCGDCVAIEVRDRGPGIQDEEAERLFQRFYRGKSTTARDGGVGLGLTICRAMVNAHGGKIAIHNREGGGAVARFTLPLGDGNALA
jgi:two-component system sensor histidine kinase KdpD